MSVKVSYPSRLLGVVAGIRFAPRRSFARLLVIALPFAVSVARWPALSAETNPPPAVSSTTVEATNFQAIIQAYLQLQEQLRATQLAIEQNRQEIKAAATQNAEALSQALAGVQESFATQRAQDLQAMQRSNKAMLIVLSTFAAMGFLTLLMMSYFQWRLSKGLAELSAALHSTLSPEAQSPTAVLGSFEPAGLRLPGGVTPHATGAHDSEVNPPAGSKPRQGPNLPIQNLLLSDPRVLARRRQVRALKTAVIVGLVCAAGLALLFYVVTYSKLGFGYFHTPG